MKSQKRLFILIFLFSTSCASHRMFSRGIKANEIGQYCVLLKESQDFLSAKEQANFKDSLYFYLKNNRDYNFNNGRSEALICFPILLNSSYDKAIVPVLKRIKDLGNKNVEIVVYVSAKLESGQWVFKVKKGHSESFSYQDSYSVLSETEIGIKVVRNLLLRKDIKLGEIHSKELFQGELYVL